MKPQDLQNLASLTAMRFQSEQVKFASIQTRERQLRNALASLLEDEKSALPTDSDNGFLERTGAHHIWKKWIDLRRSEMNLELARVMSAKAAHQQLLSRRLGEKEVAAELLMQDAKRRS